MLVEISDEYVNNTSVNTPGSLIHGNLQGWNPAPCLTHLRLFTHGVKTTYTETKTALLIVGNISFFLKSRFYKSKSVNTCMSLKKLPVKRFQNMA